MLNLQGENTFARILLENNILNEEDLNNALKDSAKAKKPLSEILLQMELCSEEDIFKAIAQINRLSFFAPGLVDSIDDQIAKYLPENIASRYNIIPVRLEEDILYIASSKPLSPQLITNLRKLTGRSIYNYLTTPSIIKFLSEKLYDIKDAIAEIKEQSIINCLDNIILEALKQNASDIHFEPQKDKFCIRFRVDGVLRKINLFSKSLSLQIISRIKVLANLDIAEKRAPQDGHFFFSSKDGKNSDIRVSILPTINGEKAVLRLISSNKKLFTLDSLGMQDDMLKDIKSLIKRPYGIILITGPTGSGKTTTLYAILQLCLSEEVNIITVEDPVEFQIDGITQVKIDHVNKIAFSNALRTILRQDPDIIMIGEIRDQETANIALQAALTGHLVLSTLHTNDASSAITRLLDMGCEPYLISSALCGVLAQRLVRLICNYCKKPFIPSIEELRMFKVSPTINNQQWSRGQGCWRCQKTGYKGRVGIFEFLKIDDAIHNEIISRASSERIKHVAITNGMRTLYNDMLLKVTEGIVSPEEALRVIAID